MWIPEPLFEQIKGCMPIPCVDLLVRDGGGRILLLQRSRPPARTEWWFPGGRVRFGETRLQAAQRKLQEECGIQADGLRELGTSDLMLPLPDGTVSHAITTVFEATVEGHQPVVLDGQSAAFLWLDPATAEGEVRHPFLRSFLGLRTAGHE